MSDYNEHLISQAGRNGPEKLVDVRIMIFPHKGINHETLDFTNLPMSRVKDAIDLLNDDHVELIPTPRTHDFTVAELFGKDSNASKDHFAYICIECGALVGATGIHRDWHNKLLP